MESPGAKGRTTEEQGATHAEEEVTGRLEASSEATRLAVQEQRRRIEDVAAAAAETRRFESQERQRAVQTATKAATREQLRRFQEHAIIKRASVVEERRSREQGVLIAKQATSREQEERVAKYAAARSEAVQAARIEQYRNISLVTKLAEEERRRRLVEDAKAMALMKGTLLSTNPSNSNYSPPNFMKLEQPNPLLSPLLPQNSAGTDPSPTLANFFPAPTPTPQTILTSPRKRVKSPSTPSSSNSKKGQGSAALRKMCREKERRQKLNAKFEQLVSKLQLPLSSRCGKVNVLQTTMRYINSLREENQRLRGRKAALCKQANICPCSLYNQSSAAPAPYHPTNFPISSPPESFSSSQVSVASGSPVSTDNPKLMPSSSHTLAPVLPFNSQPPPSSLLPVDAAAHTSHFLPIASPSSSSPSSSSFLSPTMARLPTYQQQKSFSFPVQPNFHLASTGSPSPFPRSSMLPNESFENAPTGHTEDDPMLQNLRPEKLALNGNAMLLQAADPFTLSPPAMASPKSARASADNAGDNADDMLMSMLID